MKQSYHRYGASGHLALLFQAMDKMSDEDVLELASSISWQSPSIHFKVLEHKDFPHEVMIQGLESLRVLMRTASPRVKALLLTPERLKLVKYENRLHIPHRHQFGMSERTPSQGYILWEEALASLDLDVIKQLINQPNHGLAEENSWVRPEDLRVFNRAFGASSVFTEVPFPVERAQKVFDQYVDALMDVQLGDLFTEVKWPKSKKKKRAILAQELASSLLEHSLEVQWPPLIEFALSQKPRLHLEIVKTLCQTHDVELMESF